MKNLNRNLKQNLRGARLALFLSVAELLVFTKSAPAQVTSSGHIYTKAPDGSVQDQSTPQQSMVITTVTVPANTSTAVYTPSNTTPYPRVVRIVPGLTSGGSNTSCTMNDGIGAATLTSTPIPGGYVYNLSEPSPSNVINVYCTTAGFISVEVGY